jgi:hypothetical protein
MDKEKKKKKGWFLIPHKMSKNRERSGERLEEMLEESISGVRITNGHDHRHSTPIALDAIDVLCLC